MLVTEVNFNKFICILLLSTLALTTNTALAQAPGMLDLEGKTVKNGKPLSGATITVYRNEYIEQEKIKTGKNGKFSFSLVFGADYKITFAYPGCIEMYMIVYASKLPKSKNNISPLYITDVPFFEVSNSSVRIKKYEQPFTKVIYDGKKAFMDDEAYLAQFTKDILISGEEQAKQYEDRLAKENAEKEANEIARLERENKAAYEARLRAEERENAALLAHMKKETANKIILLDEPMETENILFQKENEAKILMAQKNKEIKTNYENDLLKLVAENERVSKLKKLKTEKLDVQTQTVIRQMRKEAELKAKADLLRENQKQKNKIVLINQQMKNNELLKLVEAGAFAERSVRINNQKTLPPIGNYIKTEPLNIAVEIQEGLISTTRKTYITRDKKIDLYIKESYLWGNEYYYKNNAEIDELTYTNEIAFFSAYQYK